MCFQVHTDERPFQCTVCNMSFRTRNNLTTHLKCHTGQSPASFTSFFYSVPHRSVSHVLHIILLLSATQVSLPRPSHHSFTQCHTGQSPASFTSFFYSVPHRSVSRVLHIILLLSATQVSLPRPSHHSFTQCHTGQCPASFTSFFDSVPHRSVSYIIL